MTKGEREKETEPFRTDEERCIDTASDDFSELDTGWAWAILFASFGTFCILGGKMYAVGIIHSALLERYNESVSLTSWAGALHTALFSLGGPLSSAIIDRFSCRTALMSSGVFFILGYIGTAFANTIEVAIFTCGILAGTGGALGYTTAMVVVSFNFKRRRNLALGIAVSGVGAGVFILAPLMQMSRDYYGPVGFFIILAAMAANVITFGAMCFPSKLEIHTQRQRESKSRTSPGKQSCCAGLKLYLNVLFNKSVICLCACMFCYCLGTNLMYLYLPSFIVSKGFTALEASFLVSLSGILSVFGRLLTGTVANLNRINDIYLFSGSMGIVAIACFIYPFISRHFAGHVIFVLLFGLFFGSSYVIITSVTLPFVGINYISATIGLEFFFGGVGSIIGPVFAGLLVDISGTYEQSIIIAGTGGALGYTTAMVVVSFNFKRRRNLALGIAVSGVGAGVLILAPLMQMSRDYYGPVGFFIILAAMAANVITFGAMCFPSKLEIHTQRQRESKSRTSPGKQSCCAGLKLYLNVLFNKSVICLCACMFCYCLGTNLMYLYLPSFIVSKGFTAVEASFLVSLSGILSVFGRLLTGAVANLNRINDIYLFSGSMGIVAIACFIYPFISRHFAGHVIFVLLFGLFFGSSYVIITSVTLPFVGINYISATIGLEFFFGGVGSIIGPVFAGLLVDISGTYEQSIIIAASCILFSTVSSAVTACCHQKNDGFLHKEETIVITNKSTK